MKKISKIFNRLIPAQFIQFYDVFSSNLFDKESNQLSFINIDLLEEILNETYIFNAVIITLKDVQDVTIK